MATNKPRVMVTLKPETYSSIKRLAALRKVSMSSVMGEMADEAKPAFDRIAALMEAARMMDQEALKDVLNSLNDVEVRVSRAYEDSVLQMDLLQTKQQTASKKKKGVTRKPKK